MRTVFTTIAAGVLCAPMLALPARAQAPVSPLPQAAPMSGAAVPEAGRGRALERVERHIADLHKRLAITAEQEPKWAAFADVMRQNARRMQAGYTDRQAQAETMSAVDDLKSYAAMERARAEDVERLIPPFDTLYQTMTPAQKAGADKTFHEFQRSRGRGKA